MSVKKLEKSNLNKVGGGATYEVQEVKNGSKTSYVVLRTDAVALLDKKEDALATKAHMEEGDTWVANYSLPSALDKG